MPAIEDRWSKGLPSNRVGSVVWWSASVIEADPVRLRDAFDFAAPEFKELVRDPVRPHSALRRAVRRTQSGLPAGLRWEEIGVDGSNLVVALVEQNREIKDRRFEAHQRWTVTVCDKTAAFTPSISPDAMPDVDAAELGRLADRYRKERALLTHEDVRLIVTTIILSAKHGKGARIKDGGAIYFMPAPCDDIIDRVAPALEGAGVELRRVPILAEDATTAQQIGEPVRKGLLEEAQELAADAAARLSRVAAGEKVRASTNRERLLEIEAIRAKGALYKRLLSIGLDDVHVALDLAEKALKDAVDEMGRRAVKADAEAGNL